ncbi:hypothetical protein FGG08_006786 [Glutinoglossum americanum]|uniref:Uncharacterized protein n=1 Tax=Glutinoglossum americanum TaxID=1670608 RepID=A0A9P8KX39_9PEZI|nr:hypothetical protein FGG08_006786 [Glutinoglossum americanum]
MDAPLTIPTPKNISFEQAATLGVGSYTASLGLFEGLNIPPDHPTSNPEPKDEWVIVFGGAGSVGQYAVQLAKTCGYKVLASCSEGGEEVSNFPNPLSSYRIPSSSTPYTVYCPPSDDGTQLLKSLSATATLNHTLDHANQLAAIRSLTGGNFSRVFDAAGYSYPLAAKALSEISTAAGPKYFTTTDDWSPLDEIPGTKTHRITLGPIGREGEEKLHENIKKYIPVIKTLVEEGTVFTNGVEVLGEGGIEGLKGVLEKGEKGEKGKKGVVMVGGV